MDAPRVQEKRCPLLQGLMMGSPTATDKKGLLIPAGPPEPMNIAFTCMRGHCVWWDHNKHDCKITQALDLFINANTPKAEN